MDENISKHGFIGLVTSFYVACWQQLGKVASPVTGKVERNIEQAKYSIDMLVLLREKTKGNLTKEEESSLNQGIAALQMNYVEEMNLSAKAAADKPAAGQGNLKGEKADVKKG